jgi:transposase
MPEERCRMARVRRTSTPEFKRDAIAVVAREGGTVSEVARNLGIARSLLERWIEQSRDQDRDGGPRKQQVGETEELRQLRKRLRDVTEERDIPREGALAYFADDQK